MKKLFMILCASLFMVACGGGDCDKKSCDKGDKKECTGHGDKKACKKDCKKACCAKKGHGEEAHGHAEGEGHKCEPGCTKPCCANKEKVEEVIEDAETTVETEIKEAAEAVEAVVSH